MTGETHELTEQAGQKVWAAGIKPAPQSALEPINYGMIDNLEIACLIEQINANTRASRNDPVAMKSNIRDVAHVPCFDARAESEAVLSISAWDFEKFDNFFKKHGIKTEHGRYTRVGNDAERSYVDFVITDLTSLRKLAAAQFLFPGSDVLRGQEMLIAASRGQSVSQNPEIGKS